jgi:hypothetical protein
MWCCLTDTTTFGWQIPPNQALESLLPAHDCHLCCVHLDAYIRISQATLEQEEGEKGGGFLFNRLKRCI